MLVYRATTTLMIRQQLPQVVVVEDDLPPYSDNLQARYD